MYWISFYIFILSHAFGATIGMFATCFRVVCFVHYTRMFWQKNALIWDRIFNVLMTFRRLYGAQELLKVVSLDDRWSYWSVGFKGGSEVIYSLETVLTTDHAILLNVDGVVEIVKEFKSRFRASYIHDTGRTTTVIFLK